MKKYGFLGGSFNPITKAHLQMALDSLTIMKLDKVIFVPMGNCYQKKELLDEKERYAMIQLAISDYPFLEVSDIEFDQTQNLDTMDAFELLEKEYPNVEHYYIMGADNLDKMPTWRKAEQLIQHYQYIVIERENYQLEKILSKYELFKGYSQHFTKIENKEYHAISASAIRRKIKLADDTYLKEVLDEKVYKYIREKRLYH